MPFPQRGWFFDNDLPCKQWRQQLWHCSWESAAPDYWVLAELYWHDCWVCAFVLLPGHLLPLAPMWHGKSQASSASAPALPPTYFSSMSLFGRNCLQDNLILLPVLNKDMSRTFAIISYLSVHDWERSKYSTIWIFSGNHHQNTAIEELLEMLVGNAIIHCWICIFYYKMDSAAPSKTPIATGLCNLNNWYLQFQ